jgi:hypothetical protein
MGCITDAFRAHADYWRDTAVAAWTMPNAPNHECSCFPQPVRAGVWEIPNTYEENARAPLDVQQLSPAECKVVAEHLKQDANWQRFQVGLCIVGAVVVTAAALVYLYAIAAVVLAISSALFEGLLALGVELLGPSYILGAGVLAASGVAFVAEVIFLAGLSGMTLGTIWAQTFGPNIQNGRNHAVFLENTAQDLQLRAVRHDRAEKKQ